MGYPMKYHDDGTYDTQWNKIENNHMPKGWKESDEHYHQEKKENFPK
jgi:hypothetical protein